MSKFVPGQEIRMKSIHCYVQRRGIFFKDIDEIPGSSLPIAQGIIHI